MQTAPHHRLPCRNLNSKQFEALAEQEACHHLAVPNLHLLGRKELQILGPSHPLVKCVPSLRNCHGGSRTISEFFRTDQKPWRSNRHPQIDQQWVCCSHVLASLARECMKPALSGL